MPKKLAVLFRYVREHNGAYDKILCILPEINVGSHRDLCSAYIYPDMKFTLVNPQEIISKTEPLNPKNPTLIPTLLQMMGNMGYSVRLVKRLNKAHFNTRLKNIDKWLGESPQMW